MSTHDPDDPVVRPAEDDRRTEVGRRADDAHRRAAFGRRPSDVPAPLERRRSLIPYVIGILLLVALVPLLGRMRGLDERPPAGGDSMASAGGEVGHEVSAPAGAKQRFSEWAAEGGNNALPQESEENHPYTSQGIRLLADALAEATQGVKIEHARQRIDDLRVQADRLQSSPGVDRHAEYAHAAFATAATLIAELHDVKPGAANDGREVAAAADSVRPDAPLSPQGEKVRRYFRTAAKALP